MGAGAGGEGSFDRGDCGVRGAIWCFRGTRESAGCGSDLAGSESSVGAALRKGLIDEPDVRIYQVDITNFNVPLGMGHSCVVGLEMNGIRGGPEPRLEIDGREDA